MRDRPRRAHIRPAKRGHLVESAAGTYLLNRSVKERFDAFCWRAGGAECVFVVRKGSRFLAIEAKSGSSTNIAGTAEFLMRHPEAERFIVRPKDEPVA